MTTTDKFAIRQDPSDSSNWGIIWEQTGTEVGYTCEADARKSALDQNALVFKVGRKQWTCETQGVGHHAGGDTKEFGTRKEAMAYGKSRGYSVKRAAGCDSED